MTNTTSGESMTGDQRDPMPRDGSSAALAILPAPDKATHSGKCPPMTWWPDPVQNRNNPTWSHSGRGTECK